MRRKSSSALAPGWARDARGAVSAAGRMWEGAGGDVAARLGPRGWGEDTPCLRAPHWLCGG